MRTKVSVPGPIGLPSKVTRPETLDPKLSLPQPTVMTTKQAINGKKTHRERDARISERFMEGSAWLDANVKSVVILQMTMQPWRSLPNTLPGY
jgi:hypothetical protein